MFFLIDALTSEGNNNYITYNINLFDNLILLFKFVSNINFLVFTLNLLSTNVGLIDNYYKYDVANRS